MPSVRGSAHRLSPSRSNWLSARPTRTVVRDRPEMAGDVPIKTSIYLELATTPQAKTGEVSPESVSISVQEQGGEALELLRPGRRFADGASGWLRSKQDLQGAKSLAVYIELLGRSSPPRNM